jgi:hypothetical protein
MKKCKNQECIPKLSASSKGRNMRINEYRTVLFLPTDKKVVSNKCMQLLLCRNRIRLKMPADMFHQIIGCQEDQLIDDQELHSYAADPLLSVQYDNPGGSHLSLFVLNTRPSGIVASQREQTLFAMITKVLTTVCTFLTITSAQNSNGFFKTPPVAGSAQDYGQNMVWALGSVQTLDWYATISPYNVSLWQQNLHLQTASIASSPIFCKFCLNH